eukprot:IDg16295t1
MRAAHRSAWQATSMQYLDYHPRTAQRVARGNEELASAMQPVLFVSIVPLRTRARRCVRRDSVHACSSRANGGAQPASTEYAVATRRAALRLIAGLCGASACGAYAAERALAPRLYESATEVTTAEGLRYFDLAVGAGAEVAEGSTVLLHYTSRLGGLNGIKLDSSRDGQGGGEPYRFVVGDADAVPGFDRALRGMHVGGKRRVLCPPALAYSSPVQKPPVREF